ncbi:PREDICTED: uncharacterized protein LOC105153085, partial [Acromyrmex echinatior]|uniref:uncharacterized protein LOC105153085 n=1 Tax=Acromyrmex echinatior TaxID=103372 RepID=UPI000580D301
MPNLHGPNESVRQLYMNAVLSGALYGTPVWSGKALASRRIKARLHNVQRRLALRICRAYRTVSYAAVMVLAGIPPVEYVADALAESFARVLTGHGCFGEYLCRIGKEPTTGCRHCDGDRDIAQHTLEACPAWAGEGGVLVREIGEDLSLPAVVRAMIGRESAWAAFSSFCDRVMSQKEEAER